MQENDVKTGVVTMDNELFYVISDFSQMDPFFMNIVSSSNQWMFLSSNGGITAGRKNAENSLFPYYTDDKLMALHEITGSKSIIRMVKDGQKCIWEPFSVRSEMQYHCQRNIYKSIYGNKVIFEEINQELQLRFLYKWSTSDRYGFVKESCIKNDSDSVVELDFLDGLQNILPYGVPSTLQNSTSNLVDAYKRSELVKESGLGIFALSAIIVDRAEPSEALKANIAWAVGTGRFKYLLSDKQLENFRRGGQLEDEFDIKGRCGAYFVNSSACLNAGEDMKWYIVSDVNKTYSEIVAISEEIKANVNILHDIDEDIEKGTRLLIQLVASSDGLQITSDKLKDIRHFSNVLYNIMRGGIFADGYDIDRKDYINYIKKANRPLFETFQCLLDTIPESCSVTELYKIIENTKNRDLKRLTIEYLPLMFSRRHGDPTRPWNKFSINIYDEMTKERILDYQGNWRDIFQNWEALSLSFPGFLKSMISKFLNATTFEGYNPYRITKQGFDWETIEPDNPWSYIGYWGDHQIIYLLKLLEAQERYSGQTLTQELSEIGYVFANVPYKIKGYDDIVIDPKNTVVFDGKLDKKIKLEIDTFGSDAALLKDRKGNVVYVTLLEKLLIPLLAKLSNYVPQGGIWMNTQRPEWNDANNALVGNGLSMVTLYYIIRYLKFFDSLLSKLTKETVNITKEVYDYYQAIYLIFKEFSEIEITDSIRKSIIDKLGQSASVYRENIYHSSFSTQKENIHIDELREFISLVVDSLEQSLKANRRKDGMYHSYNLIDYMDDEKLVVTQLNEMLEGQVAVLSSGVLSAEDSLKLLDSLRNGRMYRKDQNSYMLYPDVEIAGFLNKNIIPSEYIDSSLVLKDLLAEDKLLIIEKDINGKYHFNGNFRNASDLKTVLDKTSFNAEEKKCILDIFEKVFNHKAFTGRSGTFFAYEGLGSIYWHMVSKLLLAVQESCLRAVREKSGEQLLERLFEHYYEIYEGLGVHKSPQVYGAFPIDPYSHTPMGGGAKQPGMTGQVKEDILSRFGELGVVVESGKICFKPILLKYSEFIPYSTIFSYWDVNGNERKLQLEASSLAFTYCQIPIVYHLSDKERIVIQFTDNRKMEFDGNEISDDISRHIFDRTGEVESIIFCLKDKL